jgi:hypothetical protein
MEKQANKTLLVSKTTIVEGLAALTHNVLLTYAAMNTVNQVMANQVI